MDERALGIVLVDCHLVHGAEMKVCLLAKEVIALISLQPPPKAKRIGVEDGSKDTKKNKKMILLFSISTG
jgi:hypothetical protein